MPSVDADIDDPLMTSSHILFSTLSLTSSLLPPNSSFLPFKRLQHPIDIQPSVLQLRTLALYVVHLDTVVEFHKIRCPLHVRIIVWFRIFLWCRNPASAFCGWRCVRLVDGD